MVSVAGSPFDRRGPKLHQTDLMYSPTMAPASEMVAPPGFVRLVAHPLRWLVLTELAHSDYRVRELVTRVGEPQNLVSYHLRLLRDGGLVTARRSSFDGRDSYYHLDLDALRGCRWPTIWRRACTRRCARTPHRGSPQRPDPTQLVRVACCSCAPGTAPAHRSPKRSCATAPTVASMWSAPATDPKPSLHPSPCGSLHDAVRHRHHRASGPDIWTLLKERRFDYVITLCDKAREACPDFPATRGRIHWSIPDPAARRATPTGPATRPFLHTAADIDTRIRHSTRPHHDSP